MEKTENGNVSPLANEYIVTIGGTEYKILLIDDRSLSINGVRHAFDLSATDENAYSLIMEKRSFSVFVESWFNSSNEGRISVNGRSFDLTVEDKRSLLRKSFLRNQQRGHSSEIIRAPMPGLVVKVEVSVGFQVHRGQGLVVLEAMKMENEIKAVDSGRVGTIHVEPGRIVEKGEPLVSIVYD